MLEKRGFEVLEAPSGAIGLQLARAHLPDLILCDVNMGGVGGNLTLYAMRSDPQIASIPFVLMSGVSSSGCEPPGMERGADGFLAKPFSVNQLVSSIQGWLNKPAAPAAVLDLSSRSRVTASVDPSGLLEKLNRILHITELIGNAGRPLQPKELRDLAGQAHDVASHLHRRIENCLLYAEIERLASDWQQSASLQEHRTVIQEVVEPVALEKAILFERVGDLVLLMDNVHASIPPDALKKIMDELLENAFRYSRPGNPVHLTTAIEGDHVTVSIVDQGCGMTVEQVAHAGGPMSLDQVLLAQQGSGLGLAIARRLIELHGGALIIHSEPGRGSTVTVSLASSPGL
jgi:signal transduction histidine kinase